MDESLYKEFDTLDGEGFWWFSARRSIIVSVLKKFLPRTTKEKTLLDVGCGTGYNLLALKEFGESYALETSPHAISVLQKNGWAGRIISGELPHINLPQKYNIITALDVIEHVDDDRTALANLFASLEEGGTFLVTVPAYQWLWSKHDEINHHKRRYTKKELIKKIKDVGFTVRYASYYNTFLFPPVVLFRWLGKLLKKKSESDFSHRFGFLEKIFEKVFLAEKVFLGRISFPFGLSLICVAEKNTHDLH